MPVAQATAPQLAPGPRGLALLGTIPKISRGRLLHVLGEFRERHGDVVRLPFGSRQALMLLRPEHVRHVLVSNKENYGKGAVFQPIKPILGEGLVTSEGKFWQRQRRIMQPPFTRKGVEDFVAPIAAVAAETAAALLAAPDGRANVSLEMRKAAMSVICRTILDVPVGDRQDEIARAFDYVLNECARRVTSVVRLPDGIPLPGRIRFSRYLTRLNDLMHGTIAERRRDGGDDLLAGLLDARDPESGESMSDDQLRDEIMTVFFAGHETTALALAWSWHLLATHPDAMAKLREEADAVLAGGLPTANDIDRLPYAKAVFYEALRMYPPAWAIPRQANDDDVIDGFRVRKGDIILLCPYWTHRLPDLWPEPEAFRPERFLDGPRTAQERYHYIPFGAGPRTCIGNHFATLEGQILLAVLADRVELQPLSTTPAAWNATSTLRPAQDVWMQVASRPRDRRRKSCPDA